MYCNHCGNILPDNASFCSFCGAQCSLASVIPAKAPPQPAPASENEQPSVTAEPVQPSAEAVVSEQTVSAQPSETIISEQITPEQSASVQPSPIIPAYGEVRTDPPPEPQSIGSGGNMGFSAEIPVAEEKVKVEKYYTLGHIMLCLAAVAVMAITAGVFAGLYFSVI